MRISRRDSLTRYYLLSLRGYGLFLHRLTRDDPQGVLHSHPWDAWSLILGEYTEQRLGEPPVRKRWWNRLVGSVPHRVTLTNGPVWTLFLHGKRYNRWGVFRLDGTLVEEEPWRGVGGRTSYVGSEAVASDVPRW